PKHGAADANSQGGSRVGTRGRLHQRPVVQARGLADPCGKATLRARGAGRGGLAGDSSLLQLPLLDPGDLPKLRRVSEAPRSGTRSVEQVRIFEPALARA